MGVTYDINERRFDKASQLHFKAHIQKHKVNVENLLENSVGVGRTSRHYGLN